MIPAVQIPKHANTYLDKPYVKVFWDPMTNILTSSWIGFCDFDEVSAVGHRILDAVSFEGAKKVLYDARQIEMLDESSKSYISGDFTHEMIKAGVKYAAAVFPEDIFAKITIDQIQQKLNRTAAVTYFKSLKTASDWLKTR